MQEPGEVPETEKPDEEGNGDLAPVQLEDECHGLRSANAQVLGELHACGLYPRHNRGDARRSKQSAMCRATWYEEEIT